MKRNTKKSQDFSDGFCSCVARRNHTSDFYPPDCSACVCVSLLWNFTETQLLCPCSGCNYLIVQYSAGCPGYKEQQESQSSIYLPHILKFQFIRNSCTNPVRSDSRLFCKNSFIWTFKAFILRRCRPAEPDHGVKLLHGSVQLSLAQWCKIHLLGKSVSWSSYELVWNVAGPLRSEAVCKLKEGMTSSCKTFCPPASVCSCDRAENWEVKIK